MVRRRPCAGSFHPILRAAGAGRIAALLLAVAVGVLPSACCMAAEPPAGGTRARNIVRKQLPKNVKSIALEYTVALIDDNGKETAVDPANQTFQVGDSFLVKIKPQDDMYVYVFNEGPSGERSCLIPARDEKPFFVRKDAEITLPDDGGYFTFNPPAGEEKLLVVAVPEPTEDVRILARTVFQAQSGRLKTAAEQEANDAQGAAAAKAIRDRAAAGVTKRGPSSAAVPRADAPLPPDGRITNVEPPGEGERSSYGLAIAGPDAGQPELILDIPLRSRATR